MNHRYLYVTLVASVAASAAPVRAQANPDSVHMGDDCRLAVQVLTLGQPANRREWALRLISDCGPEGGEVLASMLRQHRAAGSWDDELERVVNQSAFIVSPAVFEAALDVVSDPAAGVVARVQSVRTMASQLIPGYLAPYSAFVEPEPGTYSALLEINARAEPLPRDFWVRAEAAMRDVLTSSDLPEEIRTASTVLLRKVVVELYCDETMSLQECMDVARLKMGSDDRHEGY